MSDDSNSGGALGFLDGLAGGIVDLSGAALSTAVTLAAAKATLKGPTTADQTKVTATSGVQAAVSSIPALWWIAGGLGIVVVAFLLLRKR